MIIVRSFFILVVLLWLLPAKSESFIPKAFEVSFEQVQTSTLTKSERKSQGHMKYKSPNRLYFKINSPDEVVYVTDGQKTYYYTAPFIDGEAGELTIQDSSENVLARFFSSLKQGLKDGPEYTVEQIDEQKTKVSFKEAMKKEIGIDWASFTFKNKKRDFQQLDKIFLQQDDGTQLTLNLKDLKTNLELDDQVFKFVPPENTKINQ